jgi:sulfite exporter TauE/SafE
VSPTLFASMFAVGLATSVHCISMCGPMVVTYAVKTDGQSRWTSRITANVAYQIAKLASYLIVGLALGAIGTAFNLNGIRPWVMLVAGLFMLVLGIGMTGKAPWAARITPRPPRALINAISKLRRRATSDAASGESTLATPISFGLLTGLMPCAPLMAAELAAASSGSLTGGGLTMVAFGLGTLPLLFVFGTASSMIPGRWRKRLTFVLALVVIALGLVFLNRSAMLLGSPVTAKTVEAAVFGTSSSVDTAAASPSYTTADDGVAEVRLSVAGAKFAPADLQIPADTRVRLIVDRPDANPCSKQLVLPSLGITKDLADNGTTTIDLPETKAGALTMTCGMGMMSGRLLVGGAAGGAAQIPGWIWLMVAMAALVAAAWVAFGVKPRGRPEPRPLASAPSAKPATPKGARR